MSSSPIDSDDGSQPSSTSSLTTTSDELLSTLGDLDAHFACGGSLQVKQDFEVEPDIPTVSGPLSAPPIVIRWDGHTSRKITFPASGLTHGQSSIEDLMADCAPDTFGYNGKDILDSSYSHAYKLDNTQFSTNFHPHDYGILSAIGQTLLPSIAKTDLGGRNNKMEHCGVLAQLHKLNIHSGNSGKFLAHVDTPQSPRQFGSLVICLPHSCQGGQLQIMHYGDQITYDWSNDNSTKIQWAAFYSDCRPKVFEVKSGHRVTLTYKLYISEQTGGVVQSYPSSNPSMYPYYDKVKSLLQNPNFMKDGGIIGHYCTHSYAHTHPEHISRLPFALKGVDAIMYTTFRKGLNLPVILRPVLNDFYKKEAEETGETDFKDEKFHGYLVGDRCNDFFVNDGSILDSNMEELLRDCWPHEKYRVHWINSPGWEEIAHMYIEYRNQTRIEWHYSSLAILIMIPPFTERIAHFPNT